MLRRPGNGDEDAIIQIVGDWEVASRLARVPHPYGKADAEFFLQHVVPNEWVWALVPHGSSDLIGVVGLTPIDDPGTAELGYWLSPAYWGKGVMTEAAREVIAYAFEALELTCITSGFFELNKASGRVLSKLGFAETGRSVRPCLAKQSDEPSIDVQLLK